MDNTRVCPHSAPLEHLVDLFVFCGRPENRDPDREVVVLVNHGYVVGYSPAHNQPAWAAYRVAGTTRWVDYDRPHLYYADTRLPEAHRVAPDTFGKRAGVPYHVGHMVPNEAINTQYGRLAQMETFLMSNMSPQRGSLNTGAWKDLEDKIRRVHDTPAQDHMWAVVGPIFGEHPERIERAAGADVDIPEAYFCVAVDPLRYPWDRPSNVAILCLRIPQDAPHGGNVTEDHVVTLDALEEATGLRFFPRWKRRPEHPPVPILTPSSPLCDPALDHHRLWRLIAPV